MKITKTLRVFLILLSVMMVLPLFACGDTPEETTTKAPEQTTAPKEETTTDKKVETTEPKADATTAEPEAPATTVAPEETTEAETTSAETTDATTESGSETTETGSESSETTETETTEVETTETAEATEAPECEHVEEVIPAVAPTCEEAGLTAGAKCSLCGEILEEQEPVEAVGHAWDDGKVTTEPDCDNAGVKTFTCQNDATHTRTEAVDAKGHTPAVDAAVAPTCEKTGLTEGSHCSVCSAVIIAQQTVDALGHKWDDGVVTTDPTCTEKGVKTFTCQNDESHTKTEDVDPINHAWDNGVVTTKPTCEGKGVKTFTCQNDESHTKTEDVDALGHKWDNGVVTTEPTCEGKGVKTFTCQNDESHTKTEDVDPINHAWNDGVVTTDPTCKAEGVKTFTCKNDANHTKTETVPKADHAWVDATYDTPKTCSTCGLTEGGCLEIDHDNVFTAADIFAAYKANIPKNFVGELAEEDGVTFFRATATEAKEGTLVLNSGKNTVSGVGKYFVVVYRNKTAAINRVQLGINSAGKTTGAGGASPFTATSKTTEWKAVYFTTSNPVDLTNGAGYLSIDIFDDDSNNKTQIGDIMEIALVAMVADENAAKDAVGQYCGGFMKFPFTVNIAGVYAYSTEYKGADILPSGQQATDKAIEIDLSSLPIGGNLTNALRLGAGWAVTRGGWDYYECKYILSDGTAKTVRLYEGKDIVEGTSSYNAVTSNFKGYGPDLVLGANLFDRIPVDLTGYEGEKISLEIYGISNFGMSYKLANITNVTVAGNDSVFTSHDLYIAHKSNPNATFKSELINENGVTFFRVTALEAGVGKLVLNTGADAVDGVGKSFILVYRNNTANVRKFQLYMNAAGKTNNTGGAAPFAAVSKTDAWKVTYFTTTNPIDLTNGAGYMAIDIFFGGATAGETVDIALFAAVADEATAWATFEEKFGDKIALPYKSDIKGVVVNGTTYTSTTILPGGSSATDAPIVMDLSSVTMPASSNLTNCFKLGSGWTITRGGWDYYICKITAESGKTATIRISEGADFPETSGTLANLKNNYGASYGNDLAIGGNIMPPVYTYIDLTGFEGETVTLDVIGVSNFGMEYSIANIINVNVPGTFAYNKVDNFISFVDYTKASGRKIVDIKDGTAYGMSFTVPTGEQVNTLRVNLTNNNSLDACSATLSVYTFNGKYAESIATAPVYTKTFTSVIKSADINVKLAAGNYLVVVKYIAAEGALSTVVTDNAWSAATLPEDYAKYNLVSYKNGEVNTTESLYGGILVETVGATVPADDAIDATFEDTTAKVIVLAGQSNAAGTTKFSYLKDKLSAEEYAKYENGFSNVKIFYTCGTGSSGVAHTQVVEDFVDVKVGQGVYSWLFGPELALAAYLSENYPDEQFYIIKYAIGGTAMDTQWNATNSSKRQCLDELEAKVDSGLGLLEAAGLTPEILAFFWLQGEGDANPASRTAPYYTYQKAMMAELRERYADYAVDGDIPFIDTEINNEGFWAASYMINDAKNDIARESARNYIIDTNYYGMTTFYENNDLAHYDSTSMLLLGKLYAKKLCEIYDFSK